MKSAEWDYCLYPETDCTDENVHYDYYNGGNHFFVPSNPYDDPETVECINTAQEECLSAGAHASSEWRTCVEDAAHNNCGLDERWQLYDGESIEPIIKNHLGEEESVTCNFVKFF